MKTYGKGSRRKTVMVHVGFVWLTGIGALALLLSASCRKSFPRSDGTPEANSTANSVSTHGVDTTLPPDLNQCTRLEIEFLSTALDYVSQEYSRMLHAKYLLDADEMARLQSTQKIIVDDKQLIEEFAKKVAAGKHDPGGILKIEASAVINCFRGETEVVSFALMGPCIYIMRGPYTVWTGFKYRGWLRAEMLTKQLEPFKIRGGCAMNLWELAGGFPRRAGSQYPQADQWNDTVAVVVMLDFFRCPGVPEAKCTYAMNPNCEPNSPPDVVLLFETDAGWNRYGGPELFSFEHHNPKGGCVLLNDHRTVRFIRTEEELKQLRWK